jgi:hypothetical protein
MTSEALIAILWGQFGHSDRLRHVNFQRANLHRRRLGVEIAPVALIATAATRTAAPVVAGPPDASAGVAAGRNGLFLRRIAGPAGRQLGRLDLLVAWCGTSGRGRSATRAHGGRRRTRRFVQRSLHARLGLVGLRDRLGLRLVGHQDPLGCIHHGPDGLGLGKRLLASLDQIIGAQSFFVGLCFRICRRLGTGIFAALLECGCAIAGCCRGCSLGRACRGWSRSFTRRG